MAGVGRSLRNAGDAIDRQEDMFEIAMARSGVMREGLKAEQEVQEGDWRTWGASYQERMTKAISETASGISNPQARRLFEIETGDDIARGVATLQTRAKGREADEGRAALDDMVSGTIDAAMGVEDPARREAMLATVNDGITGAVAKGYLSAEQGASMRRTAAENYTKRRVDMMDNQTRVRVFGTVPADVAGVIAAVGRNQAEEEYLTRLALVESGGDPMAVNATSGAAGLFQFMPGTARQYGLANPHDAAAAAQAALRLKADNLEHLESRLGRPVSAGEEYLAHQQGAGGASALLSKPDANVVDVLAGVYGNRGRAEQAVVQNGGNTSMTAGEFASKWVSKFEGTDPDTALARMVPADERMAIAGDAMADIAKARDAALRDIEVARKQAETEYTSGFKDYVGALGAGANVPGDMAARYTDENIAAAVQDEQQQELMRAVRDDAIMTSSFASEIRGSSPEEMAGIVAGLEDLSAPIEGDTDLALAPDRLAAQASLHRAIDADLKARAEDPALYALQMGPVADMAAGIGNGGEVAYAQATLAEQTRLGIPQWAQRVMPAQMATETTASIMRVTPDTRGAAVAQMADQWGEAWPAVLREMKAAGLDAATYHAAIVADDPILSERIASLSATPMAELVKGLPETEVRDMKLSIGEEMSEFRAVFEAGDPTGAASGTINELHDIAAGLAVQEYRRTGNASESVRNAVEGLVHKRYSILNGANFSAYLPKDVDAANVEAGALSLLSDEALARVIPFGGDNSPEFVQANAVKLAAKRGTWVNNSAGDGLILMADVQGRPLPLMTEDGIYTVSFDEAARLGSSVSVRRGGGVLTPQQARLETIRRGYDEPAKPENSVPAGPLSEPPDMPGETPSPLPLTAPARDMRPGDAVPATRRAPELPRSPGRQRPLRSVRLPE